MKKILVVDDEFDLQQTICATLELEGYAPECAGNGRDALAKVKITGLHGRPLSFDSHNQAGRLVVLQQVKDRKVRVLDLYELK